MLSLSPYVKNHRNKVEVEGIFILKNNNVSRESER